MNQLYTVEMVDPPPGWNDTMIDVRHRKIPADRIENACIALLRLSYDLWLQAGKPGTAAPSVTVRRLDLSSFSS